MASSEISDNIGVASGGVYAERVSSVFFENTKLERNVARKAIEGVGAISLREAASAIFRNVSFIGNVGESSSALDIDGSGNVTFGGYLHMKSNVGGVSCSGAAICIQSVNYNFMENVLEASSGSFLDGIIRVVPRNTARVLNSNIKKKDFEGLRLLNGLPSKLEFVDVERLMFHDKLFELPLMVQVSDPFGNVVLLSGASVTLEFMGNITVEGDFQAVSSGGIAIFDDLRLTVAEYGVFTVRAILNSGFSDPEPFPTLTISVEPYVAPTSTTTSSGTQNITDGLSIGLITGVAVGCLALFGAASLLVLHKRQVTLTSISTHQSETKSIAKPEFTVDMTKTATAGFSKNLVLALPGYLRLAPSDFAIISDEVIGRGGSAVILKGILKAELEAKMGFKYLAVKVFQEKMVDDSIKYELALMSSLQNKSKHIIQLAGYTEQPLMIATKFYENGSLAQKIHDASFVYPEGFVHAMALGIAEGMAAIHRFSVVHFDLKPANVLLDEAMNPVIADFGIAKIIGTPNLVAGLRDSKIEGLTPSYAAPELLFTRMMTSELDKKADVYAYAITLWELIARTDIWIDEMGKRLGFESVKKLVLDGERPKLTPRHREYARLCEIIEEGWTALPAKRPSFDQIVVRLK